MVGNRERKKMGVLPTRPDLLFLPSGRLCGLADCSSAHTQEGVRLGLGLPTPLLRLLVGGRETFLFPTGQILYSVRASVSHL